MVTSENWLLLVSYEILDNCTHKLLTDWRPFYSLGMKDLGTTCRDVRTREVGIQEIHNKVKPYEVELIRRDYYANDGWETFLSYEV